MSNRIRLCARCRNHNERNPVKDHKEQCRYKSCKCERCILIIQRQQVQSALKKLQHTEGPSKDGNNNNHNKCQLTCQRESRLSNKSSSMTATGTTLPSDRSAVSTTTGCFGIPGTMSPLCPPVPFRPLPLLPESLLDPRFLLSLGSLHFPSSMMQFVDNAETTSPHTLNTHLMFPSTSSTGVRLHCERNDGDEREHDDRSPKPATVDADQH